MPASQQVKLVRTAQSANGTFGQLILNGAPLCVTCEPGEGVNKAGHITPIPLGTYACIPHQSPAHPNCWEISVGAPYTAVLIHIGNTIEDTEDCVLVGQGFAFMPGRLTKTILPGITSSELALIALRRILHSTFQLEVHTAMQTFNLTQ